MKMVCDSVIKIVAYEVVKKLCNQVIRLSECEDIRCFKL